MKHRKHRLLAIGTALILLGGMLCGCKASSAETLPEESAPAQIQAGTIAAQSGYPSSPLQEYSSYLSEGFSCTITEYSTPMETLDTLLSGESDLGVVPLPAIIKAQSEGQPLKILCNFFQKGATVVAPAEGDIDTIQDLKNRRVGYVEGSAEDTLLRLLLKSENIDSSTIEWISFKPEELNEALKSQTIDAYCGDMSYAGTAIIESFGKIISYPYQDALGYNNLVLVTTDSAISQKRDWLQEMVNTNRTVMEMVASNQDWQSSQAERLGIDPMAISVEQDNFQWLWDLEEEYVIYSRNLASQMLNDELISQMPDFNTSFDFTFLEKTNQEYLS